MNSLRAATICMVQGYVGHGNLPADRTTDAAVGLCNVPRSSVTAGAQVTAGDGNWPAVPRRPPLYASPLRTQTPLPQAA